MTNDVVPHPVTGQVLDLHDEPAGDLLHVLEVLRQRARDFKQWADAVEDELVSRGADPGLYEVQESWSREWDADDLAATLEDLAGRGRLSLADISDIVLIGPLKVNGTRAKALLDRAEEDVLVELRRCFTWKKKGRAKVQARALEIEQ